MQIKFIILNISNCTTVGELIYTQTFAIIINELYISYRVICPIPIINA